MTETIELPGGIKDGQKIRATGMGHASDILTSLPGDLLLTIRVKEHDFFKREGMDVRSEVELNLSEALLGCQITISTVHGPLSINVDPGTSSGDKMVLKNWGCPEIDPPDNYDPILLRGDHIVSFKVKVPGKDFSNTNCSEKDDRSAEMQRLLDKIIENDQSNREKYYQYY